MMATERKCGLADAGREGWEMGIERAGRWGYKGLEVGDRWGGRDGDNGVGFIKMQKMWR